MKLHFFLAAVTVTNFVLCSCGRKDESDMDPQVVDSGEESLDVHNQIGDSLDGDIILSVWYLDQYQAIKFLNSIEGVSLEIGSKINEKPESLLNKQSACVSNLKDDQLKSYEFDMWIKIQEEVVRGLYSKLGMESNTVNNGASSIEWGKKLVEMQIEAIQKIK